MAIILLADSSTTARLLVVRDLEEIGHHVEESSSGKETLAMCLGDSRPDCLILELVLHDLDGLKVLRALRDDGRDLPVVVLTDLRMKSIREKCLDLGAVAFLRKPVPTILLREKINEIVAEKSQGDLHESPELDPDAPPTRIL